MTSGRAASTPGEDGGAVRKVERRPAERDDLELRPRALQKRRRDLALRSGDGDPHSNRSGASLSRGQLRSLSDRTGPPGGSRPDDPEVRIVPGDAAVVGGRIGRGRLVENLDVRLERDEGVGEPDRDQQLAPVFGRELDRDMLAEGRRRAANVDRDIEDCAARARARACPARTAASGSAGRAKRPSRRNRNGCPERRSSAEGPPSPRRRGYRPRRKTRARRRAFSASRS